MDRSSSIRNNQQVSITAARREMVKTRSQVGLNAQKSATREKTF